MTRATPPGRSRAAPLLPVLATLAAIGLFSVMDALMKRAAVMTGVWPALFARSLIGAAALAPLWWRQTGRWPVRAVLRLHLLRGVLAAGMAGSFFYGIVRTPLAQGIALSFIAPLIALGLAALILGERIRRAAILAAVVALAGVAVIAWGRLEQEAPTPQAARGLAAILLSALLYAWNLIVQRQQAQVASPVEVALSQNLVIGAVLGLVAPLMVMGQTLIDPTASPGSGGSLRLWLWPHPAAWPDIVGAAALASGSLMLLAWAYARAEAQGLVPLEYTAFGWAAIMGWWWFGEVVTGWTVAGLVLILAGVWLGTRRGVPPERAPHVAAG